jgi:hypothetical protein
MAISVIGGGGAALDDAGTTLATFQIPNSDGVYRLPYAFSAGRYTLRVINPFSNSGKAPVIGFYSGTSPQPSTTYNTVSAGADITIVLDSGSAQSGLYMSGAANLTIVVKIMASNAVGATLVSGNLANGSFATNGWQSNNGDYTIHRPSYLAGVGYVSTTDWIYNSNTPSTIGFSAAGTTWADTSIGVSATQFGSGAGNGIFMVTMNGNRVFTSPNGTTWTSRSTPAQGQAGAAFGNGVWILPVSNGTQVMRSTDNGVNWTTHTSSATANGVSKEWTTVAYGNNIWVLTNGANGGGRIATSPDGITWTTRNPRNTTDSYWGITFANGVFMMTCTSDNSHGISSDGINWSFVIPPSPPTGYYQPAFANGAWFFTDQSSTAYMSFDNGVSWSSVATGQNFSGLRHWFGGNRFLICVKRSSPQAFNTFYSSPFATIS